MGVLPDDSYILEVNNYDNTNLDDEMFERVNCKTATSRSIVVTAAAAVS